MFNASPLLLAQSDPRYWPMLTLVVGIALVLGMIIGLKLNAFLALIISALAVSLMVEGDAGQRVEAVAAAFGGAAGRIGIVIAMAAIIGKCMLDSGAADRIVRWAVGLTGQSKASIGLMGSGFLLAIPVFFDTVFYLLVPLARSLHHQTQQHYLRYLMAIATGGAITHTLVPPTPGPLLVSANLGVEVGLMMLIGVLVALPSAVIGLIFSYAIDYRMPVPMRPIGPSGLEDQPVAPDRMPSLGVALLPVLLPVILIGAGTAAMTRADREDRARLEVSDIRDFEALSDRLRTAEPDTPAGRIVASDVLSEEQRSWLTGDARPSGQPWIEEDRRQFTAALDRVLNDPQLFDEAAFRYIELPDFTRDLLAADQVTMKPVDRRRMNRGLLESAMPDLIQPHDWNTSARRLATRLTLWGNANFALLLAALVAMATLKHARQLTLTQLGTQVEEALMGGGVIILITAAGGAFGAMLTAAGIGPAVQSIFADAKSTGIGLLVLAFAISAVLKVAQGSSTVAMIIASGMMAAIVADTPPTFNLVYIATAVGSGSLIGSWMNDSGFWVFAKMGGLTERETLRSWTPLLVVLGLSGLGFTILLSQLLPLL